MRPRQALDEAHAPGKCRRKRPYPLRRSGVPAAADTPPSREEPWDLGAWPRYLGWPAACFFNSPLLLGRPVQILGKPLHYQGRDVELVRLNSHDQALGAEGPWSAKPVGRE